MNNLKSIDSFTVFKKWDWALRNTQAPKSEITQANGNQEKLCQISINPEGYKLIKLEKRRLVKN